MNIINKKFRKFKFLSDKEKIALLKDKDIEDWRLEMNRLENHILDLYTQLEHIIDSITTLYDKEALNLEERLKRRLNE